jgi:hypothetical protein
MEPWGNGDSSSKPQKRVTTLAIILCNKFASISFAREEFRDVGSGCIGICTQTTFRPILVYLRDSRTRSKTSPTPFSTPVAKSSLFNLLRPPRTWIPGHSWYSQSSLHLFHHPTYTPSTSHWSSRRDRHNVEDISEELVGKNVVLLLSDKSSVSIGQEEHPKRLAPAHPPSRSKLSRLWGNGIWMKMRVTSPRPLPTE